MESLFEKYMETVTQKQEKITEKTNEKKTYKAEELFEDYGGESVERVITTIAPQYFRNGNAAINNGKPYMRYSYQYDKNLARICKKAKSPEELKGLIINYIKRKGENYSNLTLQDLKWVKPHGWNHIFTEIKEDFGDIPFITKEQENEYLDNYHKRFINNNN